MTSEICMVTCYKDSTCDLLGYDNM